MTVDISREEAQAVAKALRTHLVTLWTAERRRGDRVVPAATLRDQELLASVLSRVVRRDSG